MKYAILHELPGRMRVHCRNLRLVPECRVELKRWVSEHAELVSASLSARTGNLLVVYGKNTSRESMLLLLDDLRFFGVATIENSHEQRRFTVAGAAADATAKACSRALLNSLLPSPIRKVKQGFTLGRALYSLGEKLLGGDLSAFLFSMGKFLLFGLFASSLPGRIAVMTGISLLESSHPDLNPAKTVECREVASDPIQPELAREAV